MWGGISKQPSHLFSLLSVNTNIDPLGSYVFGSLKCTEQLEAPLGRGPCVCVWGAGP